MTREFVHSIKVPRLYKAAAKVLREVSEKRGSVKSLAYKQNHPNVSAIYSLCLNALKNKEQLDHIIDKTSLLTNEPRLDAFLARILITELLWGKKVLNTECRPAVTIRNYEERLRKELNTSDDVEVLGTSNNKVRLARYVRINTLLVPLKKGINSFEEEGWSLLPRSSNYVQHLSTVKNLQEPYFIQDFHIPELLVFPFGTTFHNHTGYKTGAVLLQDKASCLPARLLDPKPGSVVLDMCAAPGMKSTHLAALLNNSGKIYAVERDEQRYATLCEQIKLTGASCIQPIHMDSLALKGEDYSDVEYILVDPSCSGSGMLDRQMIFGRENIQPNRLKQLQAFQVFLLRHALLNFPNVKRVVYSTCSINPEENEEVIDEILNDVMDAYTLVDIKDLYKNNWLHYSSEKYDCSSKCLYSNLEVDLCNGFFIAVFERNPGVPLPAYKGRQAFESNSEQLKENTEPEAEESTATKKRKKRGKRRSMNFVETPMEENVSNVSSSLNVSSDSIAIIDEVPVNSDVEEVEKEPVPSKKKKIVRKLNKKIGRGTPIVKRAIKGIGRVQKKARKTM